MTMKRFTIEIDDENFAQILDNNIPIGQYNLCNIINQLHEENLSLKASATMYRNLFLELQRQMRGVKKASDLDSKDFEDLIELSKGNVFDDEIGWIHLPVKEL